MTVIPNPSSVMIESAGGFEEFKQAIIDFNGFFDIECVEMAFCNTCDCSALLGPEVVIAGTIVDSTE